VVRLRLGLGLVLVLRLGLGLALWLQLGIGIGFRRNHSWSSTFTPRRNHSLCLNYKVHPLSDNVAVSRRSIEGSRIEPGERNKEIKNITGKI